MKKYIVLSLCCICLSACNKGEELYKELQNFSQELLTKSVDYTPEQWTNAESMLNAIEADMARCNYSNVEKERIRQMLQMCRVQFALRPVTELEHLHDSLTNYQNFTNQDWLHFKVAYDTICQQIVTYSGIYSKDRLQSINTIKAECQSLFAMQPYITLQHLYDEIKINAEEYTREQWQQICDSLLNISKQMQKYNYSADMRNQINSLRMDCKNILREQRYKSYINSAEQTVFEWLNSWDKTSDL